MQVSEDIPSMAYQSTPAISTTTSGRCSLPASRPARRMAARDRRPCGASAPVSSLCCAAAALGAMCPASTAPGRQSTPLFGAGDSFRHWRRAGTWVHLPAHRRALARLHAGRAPTPSAAMIAMIDSQSVKTLRGGLRGDDGNKKLVGRTRHMLVDIAGCLLSGVVQAASIPARTGGQRVPATAC
jgi:transposase